MPTVEIPKGYFLRSVCKEYYDVRTRLVQELVSNSIDAGATRIDLTFTEEGYSCSDNGVGMDKERMEKGMLTMGGSIKPINGVGGFGNAKLVVLFAHESYTLASKNVTAIGNELNYEIDESGYFNGTDIECRYFEHKEDGQNFWSPGRMVSKAKNFLAKCFLRDVEIFINGEKVECMAKAKVLTETETYTVYQSEQSSWNANVLINGVYMFAQYLGDTYPTTMFFEPKQASVDVFTQNRDSLKGAIKQSFERETALIVARGKQETEPKTILFRGRKRYLELIYQKVQNHQPAQVSQVKTILSEAVEQARDEKIEDIRCQQEKQTGVKPSVDEVKANNRYELAQAEQNAAIEVIKNMANELPVLKDIEKEIVSDISFDFAVDSEDGNVPECFQPVTMLKKYKTLVATYKACIRFIAKTHGSNLNIIFGFTLRKDVEGMHHKKDGVTRFFINPTLEKYFCKDLKTRYYNILLVAIHEYVHSLGFSEHNEAFIVYQHNIMEKVIPVFSWREIQKQVKDK